MVRFLELATGNDSATCSTDAHHLTYPPLPLRTQSRRASQSTPAWRLPLLHDMGFVGEPSAGHGGDRDHDEERPQSELKSHGGIVAERPGGRSR